jgi:hypothetical protein
MSQDGRKLSSEDDTRALVEVARARAKKNLVTQVRRLQVETAKLQRIAERLVDIATAIAVANGITARMDEDEQEEKGEGKD